MSDDVSARELMDDAANIGGWLRELRSLELQAALDAEAYGLRRLSALSPKELTVTENALLNLQRQKDLREMNPARTERIRFLSVEIEAALARGRLVEMAAVAERYV